MVKQKRITSIMLIILLMFSLTACTANEEEDLSSETEQSGGEALELFGSEYPFADGELDAVTAAKLNDILEKWFLDASEQTAAKEINGVWISYLEFNRILKGRTEQEYRADIEEILEDIKGREMDTVFVQVRSHGDAYYQSSLYPWSSYVTGTAGGECSFDPFEILVSKAKELDISVHAWINPYRLMTDEEMEQISDDYAIKKWYQDESYMAQGSDGIWYLNAGNEEVQQLIIDGAVELLEHYDIDGIQIDDYFYDKVKPKTFGDSNKDGKSHVTAIVKGLYDAVKAEDETALFGVSPAGNFRDSPVSDSTQLTDLDLWCSSEGYLDYVAPQIYWDFEDDTAPFAEIMEKWEAYTKDSPVDLYIGLAAYKFADSDVLEEQIKAVTACENACGYILFRYDSLT